MLYKKLQIQFYPYIVQRMIIMCPLSWSALRCSYDATFYDEELDVHE